VKTCTIYFSVAAGSITKRNMPAGFVKMLLPTEVGDYIFEKLGFSHDTQLVPIGYHGDNFSNKKSCWSEVGIRGTGVITGSYELLNLLQMVVPSFCLALGSVFMCWPSCVLWLLEILHHLDLGKFIRRSINDVKVQSIVLTTL
jgi:hypothetical protein